MNEEIKFEDIGVNDEIINTTLLIMAMSSLLRQTMKRVNTHIFNEQPENTCIPNTVDYCVSEIRKALNVPINVKYVIEHVDDASRESLVRQSLRLASDMKDNNIHITPYEGSLFSDLTKFDYETIKTLNPQTYGELITVLSSQLEPTQNVIVRDFINNYAKEISGSFNTLNEFIFNHVLKEVRRFTTIYNGLTPTHHLDVSVKDIVNLEVMGSYTDFTNNDIILPLLEGMKDAGNFTQTKDKGLTHLLETIKEEELLQLLDTGNGEVNDLIHNVSGNYSSIRELLIECNSREDVVNITGVKDNYFTYWSSPFFNIIFYRALSLIEELNGVDYREFKETAFFNMQFWVYVLKKRISRVTNEINSGLIFSTIFSNTNVEELGKFENLGREPFKLIIHSETMDELSKTTDFDMEDLLAGLISHNDLTTFTIEFLTNNFDKECNKWRERLNKIEDILFKNAHSEAFHFLKKAFDDSVRESVAEIEEMGITDPEKVKLLTGNTNSSEVIRTLNTYRIEKGEQISLSEVICKLVANVRFPEVKCLNTLLPLVYKTNEEIKESDIFVPVSKEVISFILSNFKITI